MNTFSDWKSKLDPDSGLMASKAQAEFFFNLGKITRVGIEVGTWRGYSLSILLAGMKSVETSLDRVIYSIDTFQCDAMGKSHKRDGGTLDDAKENVAKVGASDLVEWIVGDNRTAWQQLPKDLTADWVYIDADHECEPTLQNARDYSQFVKRGGLVMFHDYDKKCFPGVVQAVKKAVEERIIVPLTRWDDFYVGVRE